ncbi:GDP-mannose 4,6-dehydratase [Thiohalobacter sp. IOR34]|uniref:GDP-mannose 4,6-dehydratase n=1 Tax=Thiohalobacter sp. IOR34 TaxID=3057176 RepID=UPI0025AF1CA9|nr:GDP-mannose 4,6-dehydratase [Thiohalobacter sp. IOR34]WJW76295.1 GDP-mannose 4,6-dehydratase [Thiohalobacter sp. IOR34]
MTKKALIFGISGQDGAYLAEHLLGKGYTVHGSSRDAESNPFHGLEKLGIRNDVSLHSASLNDFRNLLHLITEVEPDEIYNLAGQTSVGLSFIQPVEAFDSIALGTVQILEVIRYLRAPIRFYNAGSSECYGQIEPGASCDENTPFHPRSPYAAAKAAAHWTTANYREAYDIYACTGILFNHESPLRPRRFVTRKIVQTAVRIAMGENINLTLGNLEVWRDWGYAKDYVDAMWRMLQLDKPEDLVIATGVSYSLQDFLSKAFERLGLDWKDHVQQEQSLFRPSDIAYSRGNPARAYEVLDWKAKTQFDDLISLLIEAEQQDAIPAS